MLETINRRMVIVVGIGCFVVFCLLFYILFYGSFTITADKNTTVTLSNSQGDEVERLKGQKTYSLTLPHGEYTIESSDGVNQKATVQSTKRIGDVAVDARLEKLQNATPITNIEMEDFSVDEKNTIRFIDSVSGRYAKINPDGSFAYIDRSILLDTISWSSTTKGVGIHFSQSEGYALYVINGDAINRINLPSNEKARLAFSALRDGDDIYTIFNDSLYRYSLTTDSYDEIPIDDSLGNLSLLATYNDKIILQSYVNSSSHRDFFLNIVDTSGKTIAKQEVTGGIEGEHYTTTAATLPGKSEAIVAISGVLYRVDSENITQLTMPFPVTAVAWDDDSSLYVSSEDTVWRYQISSKESQKIAHTPIYLTPSTIQVAGDSTYVLGGDANYSNLLKISDKKNYTLDVLGDANPKAISDKCTIQFTATQELTPVLLVHESQFSSRSACDKELPSYLKTLRLNETISNNQIKEVRKSLYSVY